MPRKELLFGGRRTISFPESAVGGGKRGSGERLSSKKGEVRNLVLRERLIGGNLSITKKKKKKKGKRAIINFQSEGMTSPLGISLPKGIQLFRRRERGLRRTLCRGGGGKVTWGVRFTGRREFLKN